MDAYNFLLESHNQILEKHEALEATCAAMREALEETLEWLESEGEYQATRNRIRQALAPDAGRELLERLVNSEAQLVAYRKSIEDYAERLAKAEEAADKYAHMYFTCPELGATMQVKELEGKLKKAEAERVEAYKSKAFCRERCASWSPELEGCGEWKKNHCEVRFFHNYLRDHNHIREAE